MSTAWFGLLLVAASSPGEEAGTRIQFAQLIIRESVMVVRVPRPKIPAQTPAKWREKRGPKCIGSNDIGGAAVTQPDSVDLILKGGKRVRAQFKSSCPALDFYSGFYVRPSEDRLICADRDSVHARSGGQCEIQRFRTLVPEK